jgi:hypothetical protein
MVTMAMSENEILKMNVFGNLAWPGKRSPRVCIRKRKLAQRKTDLVL